MKQGWSKEQIARVEKVFDEIWRRSERIGAEIAMSRKSMVLLLNQGVRYVGSQKTLRVVEWNAKDSAYDTVRIPFASGYHIESSEKQRPYMRKVTPISLTSDKYRLPRKDDLRMLLDLIETIEDEIDKKVIESSAVSTKKEALPPPVAIAAPPPAAAPAWATQLSARLEALTERSAAGNTKLDTINDTLLSIERLLQKVVDQQAELLGKL